MTGEPRVFVGQAWEHPELGHFLVADVRDGVAYLCLQDEGRAVDTREVGVKCLLDGDGGWQVEKGTA